MPADSGLWALTDKGSSALRKATPGLVVTISMTDKGRLSRVTVRTLLACWRMKAAS